jgi:hypothetical protein
MLKRRLAATLVIGILSAGCAGTSASPPLPSPSISTLETSPLPPATVAPQTASSGPSGGSSAPPSIDPANFVAVVDNPWYPLIPGTTLKYRGTKDGEPAIDEIRITGKTRVVDGVTCLAVDDRLWQSGRLAEKTVDYFAQDRSGNVWYFGEDTAELDEHGKVTSREGTWHSGVDGASAGMFMEASPTVGHVLEQEHYPGHAEDRFQVIDLAATVRVPFGAFHDALLTKEWTPLEPDVIDHKFYVRGVGEVSEVTVKGPKEELVLVSVKH